MRYLVVTRVGSNAQMLFPTSSISTCCLPIMQPPGQSGLFRPSVAVTITSNSVTTIGSSSLSRILSAVLYLRTATCTIQVPFYHLSLRSNLRKHLYTATMTVDMANRGNAERMQPLPQARVRHHGLQAPRCASVPDRCVENPTYRHHPFRSGCTPPVLAFFLACSLFMAHFTRSSSTL